MVNILFFLSDWVDLQSLSFGSMVQNQLCDKFPKISILLSHLCELIVVVKVPPEPHNLRSHFFIDRSVFISIPLSFKRSTYPVCVNRNIRVA
jgi:hypothetical protein